MDKAVQGLSNGLQDKITRLGLAQSTLAELEKSVTSVQPTVAEINGILASFGFTSFKLATAGDRDESYAILGLLVADDLIRWFRKSMVDHLVEMRSTLAEVVRVQQPSSRIAFVDPLATTGDARLLFFDTTVHAKDRPTLVLITSDGTSAGNPIGVVFKPDMQN
ncbi:hypothetical protein E0H42_00930 [Rhizobium leguminosarum bv. viciae]|nr:hypothetical protein E0H42_00930 [Rhizobium leguminosarum bv. viciae]